MTFLLVMTAMAIYGQNLDVEGNARIVGKIDLISKLADSSIFIGSQSGLLDDGSNENVIIGCRAGASNTSGKLNVFVGFESGTSNVTGGSNSFFGYKSGMMNTSGRHNVFLGFNAGSGNTTGEDNVFVGYENGRGNSTGSFNTCVGTGAGLVNDIGNSNTFIGNLSGNFNTQGNFNTFLGSSAGKLTQTGSSNTFLGEASGNMNTAGEKNLFAGSLSGSAMISGDENTMIGTEAGFSSTGNGNVFLGFQAGFNETGNNKLYIENSASSTPLIYGDFSLNRVGINRVASTNNLEVGGSASKSTAGDWLGNSDGRLKKNIQYLNSEEMLSRVLKMRGVTYEWDDTKTGVSRPEGLMYGFIAQDLQEVWPEKVSVDNQGYLQTAYGDYDPMMVEAIRALYLKNLELENRVRDQQLILDHLLSEIDSSH